MINCLSLFTLGSIPSVATFGQELPLSIFAFPALCTLPAYEALSKYQVNEFVQCLQNKSGNKYTSQIKQTVILSVSLGHFRGIP